MIRVEVIKKFTLEKFDLLKNVIRKNKQNDEKGTLYIGDIFECDDEMFDYLTGNNPENKKVVDLIEYKNVKVVDADKVEVKVIATEKPKTTKKRTSKRK